MKFFSFASLVFSILFAASVAFAQEQIDVRSLSITKSGSAAPIKFDLKAVNSSQQPVNYFIQDSAAIEGIIPYTRCNPCSPPQVFNTNVFPNPISVQINSQSSTLIYFYLTSSESTPAYLGSRLFSRKREFFVSGSTKLKGRIEIVDEGTPGGRRVVAFDNDVELEGRYSIGFFKPTISPSGKKLTDFKSVEYVLFDSRE